MPLNIRETAGFVDDDSRGAEVIGDEPVEVVSSWRPGLNFYDAAPAVGCGTD